MTSQPTTHPQAGALGHDLVAAGDVTRAVRAYQAACLLTPLDADPWIGLGLCRKHLGEPRAAELALTIAAGLAPDRPGILLHRAECHLRLGSRHRARRDLRSAIELAVRAKDDRTTERAERALARLARPIPQERGES